MQMFLRRGTAMEQLMYELSPVFYVLLALSTLLVPNANQPAHFFAAILAGCAGWVIYQRIHHRRPSKTRRRSSR